MKIAEGYLLRNIADSWIVIPIGKIANASSLMVSLSESSALLWKQLETGANEDELISLLLDSYDVDSETAKKDVAEFLEFLRSENILID